VGVGVGGKLLLMPGQWAAAILHPHSTLKPSLPLNPLQLAHSHAQIPIAIASPLPDRRVRPALERLNLTRAFDAIVTAEDNPTAELENTYLAAAHQLGRPPLRCVVVGDCNRSVEAAKELGMRSVVVTGGQAAWSFNSSDLVVQRLDQLSFVNLKNLFGQEDLVEPSVPWEEVRASRAAADGEEYGSGLAAKGSGGSWQSGSGGGFGGLSGFGSGSMSSSGTVWNDEDDEEDDEDDDLGLGRRRQQQAVAAGRVGNGVGSSVDEDDDEDMEVILPPPGSAFWDMQR